jgi:hypothetical protein
MTGKLEGTNHNPSLACNFAPDFGFLVALVHECHLWSAQLLRLPRCMTITHGCWELLEFPNFRSVHLLRHVQLLGQLCHQSPVHHPAQYLGRVHRAALPV